MVVPEIPGQEPHDQKYQDQSGTAKEHIGDLECSPGAGLGGPGGRRKKVWHPALLFLLRFLAPLFFLAGLVNIFFYIINLFCVIQL